MYDSSHSSPGLLDYSQDLLVDQTIEKVSFCAPDRNLDKAFSYICRDGTTRRWICHCFLALKDSVSIARAQSLLTPLPFQPHPRHAEWSQIRRSPLLTRKETILRAPSFEYYCGLEWVNTQDLFDAWHIGSTQENIGYHSTYQFFMFLYLF